MKKRTMLIVGMGLVLVAGAAFSVLQPASGTNVAAREKGNDNEATPASFKERVWAQVGSVVGRIGLSKKSGSVKGVSKSGLLAVYESPAQGDTNAPVAADPAQEAAVDAGVRALNQVKVCGIIKSGSRSSAVLNTGTQNESVFVGSEFNVKTRNGFVALKCERIEERSVWLRVPGTTVVAEVRLP